MPAKDTAVAKAEDDAFGQIADVLRSFKCPARCPKLTVMLHIGGAKVGDPVKVGAVNLLYKVEAKDAWQLILECSDGG
jgi:hypothetical protein